jgi:hypothetical protein
MMEEHRCYVLTPYDPREAISLKEAAARAGRSENTIKNWCEAEALGRRIKGRWSVSVVALQMFLDGEHRALHLYLQGDRAAANVVAYFHRFGLRNAEPVVSAETADVRNIRNMGNILKAS